MKKAPSSPVSGVVCVVPVAGYRWKHVEQERPTYSDEERASAARFLATRRARWRRGEIPMRWSPEPRRARRSDPAEILALHLQPAVLEWPQPERKTLPPPTLCREFASLEHDPDAVLGFANKHGHLFGGADIQGGDGEPFIKWLRAIASVSRALALIDGSRAAPTGGGSRDVSLAGLRAATNAINAGLAEHTISGLMWNPRPKAFELQIQPANLLGVLWLQVAALASGQIADRECAAPGCREWFTGRADKRTCSDPCRQHLSRSRRAVEKPRRTASAPNPSKRTRRSS